MIKHRSTARQQGSKAASPGCPEFSLNLRIFVESAVLQPRVVVLSRAVELLRDAMPRTHVEELLAARRPDRDLRVEDVLAAACGQRETEAGAGRSQRSSLGLV